MMSDGESQVVDTSALEEVESQPFATPKEDELTDEPLESDTDNADQVAPAEEVEAAVKKSEETEPMSSKMVNAMKFAAKATGDAVSKVVHSGPKESVETNDAHAEDPDTTKDDADGEAEVTRERTPSAAVAMLSAASARVVAGAKTAAKVTGEAIHKVAASAEDVLKIHSPAEGDATDSAASNEKTEGDEAALDESPAAEGEKGKNEPKKLWSTVKTFSGAVSGFSSKTWSKVTKKDAAESETAAAAVADESGDRVLTSPSMEGTEEGSFVEGVQAEKTESPEGAPAEGAAEAPEEEKASSKLFKSVRRFSETIQESASAAIKAAEPVAASTAAKVSSGASKVWESTKTGTVSVVERVKAAAAHRTFGWL
jgi:hypothetical protein